ncbi:extracellular solute-binding protein [Lederbergia ruris]|uniref:ABC transporter substrate-binding protein n=1 Tax=Lederbergia ruris TaxID=217495 RepID=UPI00130DC195
MRMSRFHTKKLWMISLLFLLFFGTACSKGGNESTDASESNTNDGAEVEELPEIDMDQPITLKMNDWRGEEVFNEAIKGPVEEAFPNVTLELIPIMPYKDSFEEQFASGNIPDIVMGPDFRYIPVIKEVDLAYDMTELIEKYGFENIDRFDQNFLDHIRAFSESKEELWGIPYMHNKAALHYNKDIFDLFSVDYPTDDMTYDEVIELAAKVTGERSGTYYTGMVMPSPDRYLFPPLGITLVNADTDEPQFTTIPEIKDILETYKKVNEFQQGDPLHGDGAIDQFIAEQTLAMVPMYFLGLDWTGLLEAQEQGMNWDIVTFPKWKDQGDVSAFSDGYWVGVTSASEHKEQAFKVIEFLLSNEQVAHKIRYPEESVYTDELFFSMAEDIRNPLLADKNMESLYKYPAPPAPDGRSKYEEIAKTVLSEQLNEFLTSDIDVNTFLRELQEETEIRIKDAQAQQ